MLLHVKCWLTLNLRVASSSTGSKLSGLEKLEDTVKIVQVTTIDYTGSIFSLSRFTKRREYFTKVFCVQKTNKNNDFIQLFISFSVDLDTATVLGCTSHVGSPLVDAGHVCDTCDV